MCVKTDKQMKFKPSYKQLTIDAFRSSLDGLDKGNRWVWLGDHLPWEDFERQYCQKLNNQNAGAGAKPARMVIGAMIIKPATRLSDVDTIEMIRENPYMQYLCGLEEFTDQPVFDPTLFVDLRKRISEEDINKMTESLLKREQEMKEAARKSKEEEIKGHDGVPPVAPAQDEDTAAYVDSQGREHRGELKIDATCADAEVRYPVDINLVETGCRKLSEYLEKICDGLGITGPKLHYKDARHAYLLLIKQAKKKGRMVHDTMALLLNYLHKDMRLMMDFLAADYRRYDFLRLYEKKVFTAIIRMYHQQNDMFRKGVHQCPDRIISIFQPHLRPIVRGKAGANVEFGAKIGVSIVEGYSFIDHHSWDAYNESIDLQLHIDKYVERLGYLPATIHADKIYMNKPNRDILKELEIKSYSKPLGRPPKEPPSPERQAAMARSVGKRNEIECSFGTGKRVYQANDIRAKLPDTAECWTGMCYFAKNVMKFFRELCHDLIELLRILTLLAVWRVGLRPVRLVAVN